MTPKVITLETINMITGLISQKDLKIFKEVTTRIVDDNELKSYVEPREVITYLWWVMEDIEAKRRQADPNRPK